MQRIKFFVLLFLCTSSVMAQRKNLLLDANFNDGILHKFEHEEIFDPAGATISDSVMRHGQKSVRIEVRSNNIDSRSIRSEFASKPETNSERWYGLSIFAPKSYLSDVEPEIVTQWHNVPDSSLEYGLSPSLSMWVVNGRWDFHIMWDTARITPQGKWMGSVNFDLGSVVLNEWTDWVFHIKFSYKADGLVEIYKNGKKVISRQGPNVFNDAKLPYWKVGVYKWVYKDHNEKLHKYNQRVLFYSGIRKGNEKATYSDVAP
ncbi:MAG: hypothetical protein JWR05_2195 [Mucilaginibacter sp.]|nr:hypothetical protein [Mucilaginibacter sp.]